VVASNRSLGDSLYAGDTISLYLDDPTKDFSLSELDISVPHLAIDDDFAYRQAIITTSYIPNPPVISAIKIDTPVLYAQ
jgi:hypothetical protein